MALEVPDVPVKIADKKVQYIIGAVIVVAALVPSVYFYSQSQQAQARLANPNLFAAEEAKKYIDQVGKLMILPKGETPTLATVNDKDKLKNQPFFANAENGDKVLIYSTAKKAILFRPSLNKIIDVAPINVSPEATKSATQTGTQAPATVKFVIRNGTKIVGLTKTYETELKSKITNAEVVDRDNAKTADFTKSFLVDVQGTNGSQVTQLAAQLGLTVSPLPSGESTPSADFLIILGADKSK
jgi:hypothetical protein